MHRSSMDDMGWLCWPQPKRNNQVEKSKRENSHKRLISFYMGVKTTILPSEASPQWLFEVFQHFRRLQIWEQNLRNLPLKSTGIVFSILKRVKIIWTPSRSQ